MNSFQEELEKKEPGATIVPVILSTDKTQLTLFGNTQAYPVSLADNAKEGLANDFCATLEVFDCTFPGTSSYTPRPQLCDYDPHLGPHYSLPDDVRRIFRSPQRPLRRVLQ